MVYSRPALRPAYVIRARRPLARRWTGERSTALSAGFIVRFIARNGLRPCTARSSHGTLERKTQTARRPEAAGRCEAVPIRFAGYAWAGIVLLLAALHSVVRLARA